MTDWKIITRMVKGKEIELDEQIDQVGNIYQRAGGVISKACQKCKNEFDAPTITTPLKQKIPLYKCDECNFINHGANAAMDHTFLTKHKILKTSEEKIVGYDNIITGNKSMVTKIYEDGKVVDVIVLCMKCHESKS